MADSVKLGRCSVELILLKLLTKLISKEALDAGLTKQLGHLCNETFTNADGTFRYSKRKKVIGSTNL